MTFGFAGLLEAQGYSDTYRWTLAHELALAGRTDEAVDLARGGVTPALRALALTATFTGQPAPPASVADELAGILEELEGRWPAPQPLGDAVLAMRDPAMDEAAERIVALVAAVPGMERVLGARAGVLAGRGDAAGVERVERLITTRPLAGASAERGMRLVAVCARAWRGTDAGADALRELTDRLEHAPGDELAFDVVPAVVQMVAERDGADAATRWVEGLREESYAQLRRWKGGESDWPADGVDPRRAMAADGVLRASCAAGLATTLGRGRRRAAKWARHAVEASAAVERLEVGASADVPAAIALAASGDIDKAVGQLGPERRSISVAQRLIELDCAPAAIAYCRRLLEDLEKLGPFEYAGERLGRAYFQQEEFEDLSAEQTRVRTGLLVRLSLTAETPAEALRYAQAAADDTTFGLAAAADVERAAIGAELAAALAKAGQTDDALEHIHDATEVVVQALDEPSELLSLTMQYLLVAIAAAQGTEEAMTTWSNLLILAGRVGMDPVVDVLTVGLRALPAAERSTLEPSLVAELIDLPLGAG